MGEHVDCLDTINKWCNAEVREIDQANKRVFVHFTGFAAKYDEWIECSAEAGPLRIQKQWRRGMPFQLNNRVDVLDQMGKWLPGGIAAIETDEQGYQCAVKIHFVGYKPKWDEVIPLDENGARRIREVGAFTNSHGWARYNQAYRQQIEYEKSKLKDLVSGIKQQ